MRWPPDHPAVADAGLSRWRGGADEICPEGEPLRTLRYWPGQRVATLVRTGEGQAVLKIYCRPRARGNHRRLQALGESGAAGLVPRPIAVDHSGHVGLLEFVHGVTLDRLCGEPLTAAARQAGQTLRCIHGSGAELDRKWSCWDEAGRLREVAGPQTRSMIEQVLAERMPRATERSVPSHRDCNREQAVLTGAGVRFIDADDAAMAPAALDPGNFTAYLTRDEICGLADPSEARAAAEAFLDGYGGPPPGLAWWQRLALARLAGLAETRDEDPQTMRRLLIALESGWPA
jgi:Ser/Thr protein kinase RdoA (MazF antagonist)